MRTATEHISDREEALNPSGDRMYCKLPRRAKQRHSGSGMRGPGVSMFEVLDRERDVNVAMETSLVGYSFRM